MTYFAAQKSLIDNILHLLIVRGNKKIVYFHLKRFGNSFEWQSFFDFIQWNAISDKVLSKSTE